MSGLFSECVEKSQQLHTALLGLREICALLQLTPMESREWYQLFVNKLLPQLRDDSFLVVAVVGGTNIGKSVIFNHIAGCRASSTGPLASGTRHPVCLVPSAFAGSHDLGEIFPGFRLRQWGRPEDALREDPDDLLFWRVSESTPSRLLVLDTPDIDSDARVNWRRADKIRQCADVLIAVLTQQKYNDAAVKQFFRRAAAEDKAVIVVFNQCALPEDESYWPLWLETFCTETGIRPEWVYVVPNDRRAAESNQLPFLERGQVDREAVGRESPGAARTDAPRDLGTDLARLRFGEIKLRTLSGALAAVLDDREGVPGFLHEVERRSGEFRSAVELLGAQDLARIDAWPTLPNSVLVAAIRNWWRSQREGWPARVHDFYNRIGDALVWPLRILRRSVRGAPVPRIDEYRGREWEVILETVGRVYERLRWLSECGNDQLRPRLQERLSGQARSALIERLRQEHERIDLEEELSQLVSAEMGRFRDESPQYYTFLKRLDSLGAAVRPVTSVVLFLTGLGPAGQAATHLLANSAIGSAMHVASDVVGGTLVAAVGESAISSSTAAGAGYLEAKFRRLQELFAGRRANWLATILQRELLGDLLERLQLAASVPESEPFRRTIEAVHQLQAVVAATVQRKSA